MLTKLRNLYFFSLTCKIVFFFCIRYVCPDSSWLEKFDVPSFLPTSNSAYALVSALTSDLHSKHRLRPSGTRSASLAGQSLRRLALSSLVTALSGRHYRAGRVIFYFSLFLLLDFLAFPN